MDADTPHRAGRWPARLAIALVVLATILLLVTNLAYWARGTLLDSDEFTEQVSSVLRREEASARIGEVLATQALSSGDLQNRISMALPQNASTLPFLLEGQLHELLARTLTRLLMLETTEDLIETAIRRLHDLVVSTLEGRRDGLDVENGSLVIHLGDAVSNVLNRIGVEAGAGAERDIGTVVLVQDARSLDNASRLVRGVEDGTPLLFVGAVVAFGASVFLARDRARGLTVVGYGVVIAGVFSLIAWRLSKWGVEAFLEEAPVARMIVDSLASNLRLQSLIVAAAGLVIVAIADERIRGWVTGNAGAAWSRVEAFGIGRAVLVGAAGLTLLLLIS